MQRRLWLALSACIALCFDWVTKSGLEVQRVAAVHGPSTTWDALRAAVEKKRAGR